MSDVDQTIAAVEAFEREMPSVRRLSGMTFEAKANVKKRIRMENAVVSNDMYSSVELGRASGDFFTPSSFRQTLRVDVGYAGFVAAGTGSNSGHVIGAKNRPYPAPTYTAGLASVLERWARRKHDFIPMVDYESIGYVLARQISEEGQQSQNFWNRPILNLSRKMSNYAEDGAEDAVERFDRVAPGPT